MKKKKLSPPNVTYRQPGSPGDMSASDTKGIICNPTSTGIGPYPKKLTDSAWIQAAVQLIDEEGAEQFLVNMLHMLRQSLAEEAMQAEITVQQNADAAEIEDQLRCSHDNFLMLKINNDYVCIGEYVFAHLYGSPIQDIITEPVLTLVFQNGHTMPLLCPDCGQSLHIGDEDEWLNTLAGLFIVDMDWYEETQVVILDFGHEPERNDDDGLMEDFIDEEEPVASVAIHPESIRGLTCPHHHQPFDDS